MSKMELSRRVDALEKRVSDLEKKAGKKRPTPKRKESRKKVEDNK